MKTSIGQLRPKTKFGTGATFIIIVAVVAVVLGFKAPILTKLRSGETITAEFSSSYRLRPNESKVKVVGLKVGVVSSVKYTDRGTALVSMKVDKEALRGLGPKPTAVIAPLTILGGVYSVELRQGGGSGSFTDTSIPMARTGVPVELDRILERLPGDTRAHTRSMVGRLDETLTSSDKAIKKITGTAPGVLDPANEVFVGARGTHPGTDLPQVVENFYKFAEVLTRESGELDSIVQNSARTTDVLGQHSDELAQGFATLPETLRTSRSGLEDLQRTLDRLEGTAEAFTPAAKELNPLLKKTNPVLAKARPLMADLRPLMADADPLMQQLAPAVSRGDHVLKQVNGPVMDRVNGPFTDTMMNTWRGVGPYKGNGAGPQADHKFYEELGYLATNMDRSSMTQDNQGSMLGFQVGVGQASIEGLPFTLPNLIDQMLKVVGGAR